MSSIGSVVGGSIQSITGVKSTSATSSSSASAMSSAKCSDSTSVSGPGAMLAKLKSLKDSDPAKFAEVMSDISSKLEDAAEASSDPHEKEMMSDLSTKFATAGKTGDLSVLEPPRGRGGAGKVGGAPPAGPPPGPPPGGAAAKSGSSSSSSESTEPADTNEDGKVSTAEQQAYDAKRAAAAYDKTASSAMSSKAHDLMSRIDSIVESSIASHA